MKTTRRTPSLFEGGEPSEAPSCKNEGIEASKEVQDRKSGETPETKQSVNSCSSPLTLTRHETELYKANKLLDQSGEYVDKKIADEMKEALEYALPFFPDGYKVKEMIKEAIAKAEE